MSLLDKISCLLFPLGCNKTKRRRQTPLEKFIESHNPQTLEEVERLSKQYLHGTTPWRVNNDNLYR